MNVCLNVFCTVVSKYADTLAQAGNTSILYFSEMWKIVEMKKIYPFFFSQKFCIKSFTDSLIQNVTVRSLGYSQHNFVVCLVVT